MSRRGAITPATWGRMLSAPPILGGDDLGWRTSLVRRWTGTDAAMSQPPLDHHYVIVHLGGRKTVERRSLDGPPQTFAVEEGTISIAPAGSAFEWRTSGPIDFAHFYVSPARFDRIVALVFDREPSRVALTASVGIADPLLAQMILCMLDEVQRRSPWRAAYLDALSEAATIHLAGRHSSLADVDQCARHALAPSRLRRVLAHIEASLGGPITLENLASVAGLSRYHFGRVFRSATGEAPLAFVAQRRVERARMMLRDSSLPLSEIARQTGFASPAYFSTAFRRVTGMAPSDYRRQL